jgi:hypothetical protein
LLERELTFFNEFVHEANGSARYGVSVSIRDAYRSGLIAKVFNCADNSGTIS